MNNLFELFENLKRDREHENNAERIRRFTVMDAYSLVWMDTLPEAKERSYCPKQRENLLSRAKLRGNTPALVELFAMAYYIGFTTVCDEMGYDHSHLNQASFTKLAQDGQLGIVNPFKMLSQEEYTALLSRKTLPAEKTAYKGRRL